MKSETDPLISDFMQFIAGAPTSYHVVASLRTTLAEAGFIELDEKEEWELKPGKKYFLTRGGSLIAFFTPKKSVTNALILASHTDSPAFKLKPHSEYVKEGVTMLAVEVYGVPLLTSWLNRDLGIAGQVLYADRHNRPQIDLINIADHPVTIAQVAIHLDRKVNDEGLLLNKQEHLSALAGINEEKKTKLLESLIKKQIPLKEILGHDLFLYPLEKPRLVGLEKELLAAYRLDSLASVHAISRAFIQKKNPSDSQLAMIAFWDNEEIGSNTASGAGSPFFSHSVERVFYALNLDRSAYLRALPRSLCVSVDLSHSVHPNYADKHDPLHKPQLGQGVLIKTSAQKRYATDAGSMKSIIEIAKKYRCKFQAIAPRNDIPSGSTIGPIQATLTGIPTVDIGIGQLSMHSARELMAVSDQVALYTLLKHLVTEDMHTKS